MEDIFIDSKKRKYLTVNIYYYKFKKGDTEEYKFVTETYKELEESQFNDLKLEKIIGKFIVPNFEEESNIKSNSAKMDATGTVYIDRSLYQKNIIKKLLKKIITDDEELIVDEENYGSLDSRIASTLFKGYEETFINPYIKEEHLV